MNLSPICRLVTRLTPRTEMQCNTANRLERQLEQEGRGSWRTWATLIAVGVFSIAGWVAIWLLVSLVW